MHYPAERSAWLAAALGVWSVAGLLALAAWAVWGAAAHPRALIAGCFLAWLLAGLAAWRFWAGLPVGTLAWDGAEWEFLSAGLGKCGALSVHLDLQHRLCVRLQPPGGPPLWVWLERQRAPHRWGDLRRAVYSRPGTGAADTALPAQPPAGMR